MTKINPPPIVIIELNVERLLHEILIPKYQPKFFCDVYIPAKDDYKKVCRNMTLF